MKKLLLYILLFLFLITGCSSDKVEDVNTKTSGSFSKDDLVFVYENNSINLDDEIDDVLSKLSSLNEYDYSEAESCYYPGLDKTYKWDGLELITYPNTDGSERLCSITIKNDSFATSKGISVGSKASDVVDTYGDKYTKEGLAYRYSIDDNHYLDVYVLNDIVDSISYILIP